MSRPKGFKQTQITKDKISATMTGRKYPNRRGENAWNWKGGRRMDERGYIQIRATEHPNAIHGYVLEHRLVMEKYLGRYLESWEHVHHKNRIRDDNRLENLEIVTSSEHMGMRCFKVKCPFCGKTFLTQ